MRAGREALQRLFVFYEYLLFNTLYSNIKQQTGTNILDGVGGDMATSVIAVNTGEDVHDYHPH